jgi:phage terminase Nu1 subunit (DNA packaging protein)
MAKLAQLDYDVKIGKLVSAEEVKNKVFQAARVTRDAILNIPDRITGELAAETDYHRVYDLLKRELQQALEEMTNASKL